VAFALALLAAAASWAYAPSFRGVFALDDVRALVRNETIRSLWPPTGPLSPPGRSTVAGRPVANLSFAVNYAVASSLRHPPAAASGQGGSLSIAPQPLHAGNLLIHVFAAFALFGVVRRTLLTPRLRATFGMVAVWIALAVSLLWVVHPLTTAAVTYIVQRVESLMSLFYLLTIYAVIRVAEGSRVRWWTAAAIVSCALGMGTKEIMVTAPLVAAAWWWLFAPRAPAARQGARWLFGGLVATWAALALLVAGERRGPSLELSWAASWSYLLAQAEIVVHYVRLALWPSPLVFLYDWPLGTSLAPVAWQAAVLVSAAAATTYGVARRHPPAFLGAAFFLILAPSSSVLPVVTEVAAEHRMYLPLAAVITGIVIGGFVLGRRLIPSPKAGAAAAIVAVVAVTAALGAATRDRNRVYWSAESLWADTVAKRPGDSRAKVAYAEALADAGRLPEAQAQLETAIGIAPNDPAARVRLAVVLARQGRFREALPHAEHALALRPDDPDARRLVSQLQRAGGGIR
jgi:tetratricopeptide (TPR) repeat protein